MAEVLAGKTTPSEWLRTGAFATFRAEALFASALQPSGLPSTGQARRSVVATTLRRLGVGGCAARTAAEFGDHPDTSVVRMRWALATIRAVYPPTMHPTTSSRPLVCAS